MRKKIFLTTIIFVVSALSCFAQLTDPCPGVDNDTECPLDTWVVVLAVAAFAVTVVHLYRKQKSLQA